MGGIEQARKYVEDNKDQVSGYQNREIANMEKWSARINSRQFQMIIDIDADVCARACDYTHIYFLDLSPERAQKQQHPSSNEHT